MRYDLVFKGHFSEVVTAEKEYGNVIGKIKHMGHLEKELDVMGSGPAWGRREE